MEPQETRPDLPAERAYPALTQQLSVLKEFQGTEYRQAKAGLDQWYVLTEKLILRSFGSESTNLRHFRNCRSAGQQQVMVTEFYGRSEEPHDLYQQNFEARLECFRGILNSCLAELKMDIPESEIKGVYEPGQEYEFYRDVKSILALAESELFVIDPYLSTEIFETYGNAIPRTVHFRLLSSRVASAVTTLAQKYASGGNFEFRSSGSVHDRVIFAGRRVWLCGQSLKDAAKNKPTYIVEHDEALQRQVYEQLWQTATPII
jgi:hypothetical protein